MTQSAGLRGFPEPGTLDVLFVAYGRGHIQAIVSVAQRMQAQGYTISVFAVTTATAVAEANGLPHFSTQTCHRPATRMSSAKARAWDGDRFTVLYASTPEPARHPFTDEAGDPTLFYRDEERLSEIFRDRPDLELVLRRHPSEDQEIAPGERIFTSGRSEDVNALIHAVDMVVVTCSTVGLHAYLAGVPMVSVDCSVISNDAPFGDFGMSRSVPLIEAQEAVLLDEITR